MALLNVLLYLCFSLGISFLSGIILLRLIKKPVNWRYLSYGMSFFFVGIGLHSLIALPVAVWKFGFKIFLPVSRIGVVHLSLWEIIYYALAAGVGQEMAKGMPVWMELKRTKNSSPAVPFAHLGIDIGLGFSMAEIILIALTGWQVGASDFTFSDVMIGGLERFSATLFHIGTATWIISATEKKKILKALIICILLHALVDFSAGFFEESVSAFSGEIALLTFSVLFLLGVIYFVFWNTKVPSSSF